MARYVSLLIITVLILCLGATFYQVLAPFLMPLFLAAMASLLVQPILRYFMQRWPNRLKKKLIESELNRGEDILFDSIHKAATVGRGVISRRHFETCFAHNTSSKRQRVSWFLVDSLAGASSLYRF